jgi:hypothetical protein
VDGKNVFLLSGMRRELIRKWKNGERKKQGIFNFNRRETNKHDKSREENVKEENKNRK